MKPYKSGVVYFVKIGLELIYRVKVAHCVQRKHFLPYYQLLRVSLILADQC